MDARPHIPGQTRDDCRHRHRSRRTSTWSRALLAGLAAIILPATARAEVELPLLATGSAIEIQADNGIRWYQGGYQVWQLDNCQVRQADMLARGRQAIVWVDHGEPGSGEADRVLVYLEGPGLTITHESADRPTVFEGSDWYGQLRTTAGIRWQVANEQRLDGNPAAIYERARAARGGRRDRVVRPAQLLQPVNDPAPVVEGTQLSVGKRKVRINGRSNVNWDFKLEPPIQPGGQAVVIAKNGIKLTIEGLELEGVEPLGRVIIETDSMVMWTTDPNSIDEGYQEDVPLEMYLEGNIVFRQADRVIYADRMYYNANNDFGMVLNDEVLTPIAEYDGLLRLKADVLQQVDQQHFRAYGAAITSSRMGVPSYWFQAEEVTLEDRQQVRQDPLTGQVLRHPGTNEPIVEHRMMATSRDNFIYLGGVPIFYWPVMATDLTSPSYYVDRLKIKSDSVYGMQVLADLDAYQLFGIDDAPEGTRWLISTDVLSKRGFALGTQYSYDVEGMFRLPGPARGWLDAWGLQDDGLDNLGADRRALVPEKDFRGRVLWAHRQLLGNGMQLTAEIGLITDRNFLEQFYEQEWDERRDQRTGIELKRLVENSSWSVAADIRLNDFFTQTEWLPRFDHYMLGQSILGNRLTWHEHTRLGFGRVRTPTPPEQAVEAAKFDLLAGEQGDPNGLVLGSRQEISMPTRWKMFKLAPYLLGDASYYGNDIHGQSMTRLLGQAGVRASLPMWQARPEIQSELLNLNGLAHKVSWYADLYVAEANQNMDQLPRYDPLDDDATEHFRRRFFFDTFAGSAGGNVHPKWDERFFALRRNMQGSVSAGSAEIADDMIAAKVGVHQRWQTKRGVAGQERIIDWMVLDIEGTLFPNANRDNFGQHLGLLDYDFRWHLGDRLTLLSDGYADFFGDGLRMVTVGGLISRPERGRLYVGFRYIEGPIESTVVHASLSYRLGEKWAGIAGTSFDLGDTGNIGQRLDVVKIGESALLRFGINMDQSRDNLGVHLSIEPRFLASRRFSRSSGIDLPPVGAYGLE